MNRKAFFVVCTMLLVSPIIQAFEKQNIDALKRKIETYTQEYFKQQKNDSALSFDTEFTVGNLDPRLQLHKCDDNLTLEIREPPHNSQNVTIKVRCAAERTWTVFIPIKVNRYANVLVVNKSLNRGSVLTTDDIEFSRVNLSYGSNHLFAIDQAVGKELKRPMSAGGILSMKHLQEPDIIYKGQQVTVKAESPHLSVKAPAIALSAGHMGELIKVKNQQSQRVISVTVVGPGEVSTRY